MVANLKVCVITAVCVLIIDSTNAERICHQCIGINCQRMSYAQTEKCADELDTCVTIFASQTVQAQGCLENTAVDLRVKCSSTDGSTECYQCNDNLCNNVARSDVKCVQCDSNEDTNCRLGTAALTTAQCPISRASNSYCYISFDDKHIRRGCASSLKDQQACLDSSNCLLCSPIDITACNRALIHFASGSNTNSSGTNSGAGSPSGTNSGTISLGSNSGSNSSGSNSGMNSFGSNTGTNSSVSNSGTNSSGSNTGTNTSGSNSGTNSSESNSGTSSTDYNSNSTIGSEDSNTNNNTNNDNSGAYFRFNFLLIIIPLLIYLNF